MNKVIIAAVGMSFLLAACETNTAREFRPQTTVRVINSMTYPEFPNVEPLPPINVLPWRHDMPRDVNIVSVKNITACRKVETFSPEDAPHVVLPVEEQPVSWWKKCGENPIFPDSNIFIGFSQVDWNIILENFAKLRERNWQYKQRIIEINRQREAWREKAEAERIRIENLQNDESKETPKKVSEKAPKGAFEVIPPSEETVKEPEKESTFKRLKKRFID